MRALLGERLGVVTGEFLTFGSEAVINRIEVNPGSHCSGRF